MKAWKPWCKRVLAAGLAGLTAALLLGTTALGIAPYDIQRHWAGDAVNTLLEHGVVHGYPDGMFRPEQTVTREEAAKMLAMLVWKIGAPPETKPAVSFSDVSADRWSKAVIDFLVVRGCLTGYPDGTFQPGAPVTRGDFSVMVYRYLERAGDEKTYPPTFSDVVEGYAYNAIYGLKERGILTGYPDGTFRPGNTLTRGEAAAILNQLAGWPLISARSCMPVQNVIPVKYISQLYPVYAVVGCEPTSLLMGMQAKGYATNVTLRQFLDAMPKTASNPAKGFVGSPYKADKTKQTRTTIYPPILAQYASGYGNVSDFSWHTPEDIQLEVLYGNPVVIYATLYWKPAVHRWYNIEGARQYLLSNNHAVLVCGYNRQTQQYYIADPYNVNNTRKDYFYWISASKLDPIYNLRQHALVVR